MCTAATSTSRSSGRPFLLGGDIITQIDGASVADEEKLGRAIGSLKVGVSVRLTLYREQKTHSVDVAIIERPVPKADYLTRRALAPAAAGSQTTAGRAFLTLHLTHPLLWRAARSAWAADRRARTRSPGAPSGSRKPSSPVIAC